MVGQGLGFGTLPVLSQVGSGEVGAALEEVTMRGHWWPSASSALWVRKSAGHGEAQGGGLWGLGTQRVWGKVKEVMGRTSGLSHHTGTFP